jgi:DNA-binding MarR family transcriptional regulator
MQQALSDTGAQRTRPGTDVAQEERTMEPTGQGQLYRETIQKFLTLYRYLRKYSRQMQQEGLSGRKVSTLRYLVEAGPLTIGQLGDYLNISDSSTSELVASLKEKRLLSRRRCEEDNRVVYVEATPQGHEIVAQTPLGGFPLLREALKTLPEERLSTIHQAMTDMLHLLEIDDEQ